MNTGENKQTWRFRWSETPNGYYVTDTRTNEVKGMGDGVDMFCPDETEKQDCLTPGTQQFYDALNAYFENEQQEVEDEYFGIIIDA